MDDALHSSLIERVVLDRTHLHKCLLRSCVIVSDQLGTGNRQLARVVLQNVGERRNQPRQLDGVVPCKCSRKIPKNLLN